MGDGGYLETLEMLAATIAHEVKNPLALIQANVDFIELMDKEKKHSVNCRVIKEELRKTNEMLCGLIDMFKADYTFEEEVDVCYVIADVVNHYMRGTGDGVVIRFGRPMGKLMIKGNSQLLNIAISNIIKNAVEAVGEQGTVSVSICEMGDNYVITVEDDGGGVSKDARDALIASRPFTTKIHGNGIGIAICRRIIEEHSGSFDIKNIDNGTRGCVVEITLPIL